MARARAIDTRLEKLIPATDELFVAGILTKEEIKQLVKDRTFHEYKLVARPLLMLDVKNAINYELALEKKIADYCNEFNRKAAMEASAKDENGKRKAKSGAPPKKLQLKHRWAVQDRIESIYRIGLRHLFTQRKAASLLQLKRKSTLTAASLTGVSQSVAGAEAAANAANASMDDYEILRRECVQQLKAFKRGPSLSKMYAEWLTRSPQDAFLWSEAALFEAQSGRNDEARAIIQQALATLRQSHASGSNAAKAGQTAQATADASVKLAGKDFARQRASEDSKEVFGTALLIEILFAKRLLEGVIETAVRNDDKTPAVSLRNENGALAAIVFDLALAEAIVLDAAQPTVEGQQPFLCPDLGLHLYSVAVCHQFTASLCRKILLQTLATAASFDTKGSSSTFAAASSASKGPLSALLTELFLSDIRFTATNCVSGERFATDKALADIALLQTRSNGDDLKREWVVRQLHRKHRVVTLKEKKEKVLASVGAAVTLILAIQSAEKQIKTLSKTELIALGAAQQNTDAAAAETTVTTTLFSGLLRTIIVAATTSAATGNNASVAATTSLINLRVSLSDAVVELMSLSRDLVPIHLDDARTALAAYDDALVEDKKAHTAAKEREEKAKAKKRAREGITAAVDEQEKQQKEDDSDLFEANPASFLAKAATGMFLFSQQESSKILRIVLLLEVVSDESAEETAPKKPLAIVSALDNAMVALEDKNAKAKAALVAATNKKETAANLQLYRELCTAAALLTTASATEDKKDKSSQQSVERKNRRVIIAVGNHGAALLKAFVEVAFADGSMTVAQQSTDVAAALDAIAAGELDEVADGDIDDMFSEAVTPSAAAYGEDAEALATTATAAGIIARKTAFTREQLWWGNLAAAAGVGVTLAIIDTRFLSVRMTAADLVTLLGIAQPSAAVTASADDKKKTTAVVVAPTLDITTREEVATHISRVLALVDNEAALLTEAAAKQQKKAADIAASAQLKGKKAPKAITDASAIVSKDAVIIPKIAAALKMLVCTPHQTSVVASSTNNKAVGGTYLPYDPSLWRLFAALQFALAQQAGRGDAEKSAATTEGAAAAPSFSGSSKLTTSSALFSGAKTTRDDSSSSDSDSDDEGAAKKVAKKKLRVGTNGTTAAASSAAAASSSSNATATTVIAQRVELESVLEQIAVAIASGDEASSSATTKKQLVSLSRRLYHLSLQIISGGSSHASLPTGELREERLRGIIAVTLVEVIAELEAALGEATDTSTAAVGFNSSAVFLAAQVLRFNQLVAKLAADGSVTSPVSACAIHGLLTQLTRVHNLLLPPIRILELTGTTDALGHGYCTPIPRVMLRKLLIPVFAAANVAAAKAVGGAAKSLVTASEKVLHALIAQLTSLYTVEVKEAGKFGNGIRSSSQYAVVQQKEVSDYIIQNRREAFLSFCFPETTGVVGAATLAVNATSAAGALTSAAATKTYIVNSQVGDWLLAVAFEQHHTKNLQEARAVHQRAVQTVEAPQIFLAAVAAGTLTPLY